MPSRLIRNDASPPLGIPSAPPLTKPGPGGEAASRPPRRGIVDRSGLSWFRRPGRDTMIALFPESRLVPKVDSTRRRGSLRPPHGRGRSRHAAEPFPRRGESPEYHAVDASLWYFIAVWRYSGGERRPGAGAPVSCCRSCAYMLAWHEARHAPWHSPGCRRSVELRREGPAHLMDAMRATGGDRRGKPVEIQALWINVLA